MKNYDPNIRWGLHTIKVSFQRWDYKGYVTFVKGGNCKGLDILELEVDDLYDKKFKETQSILDCLVQVMMAKNGSQ